MAKIVYIKPIKDRCGKPLELPAMLADLLVDTTAQGRLGLFALAPELAATLQLEQRILMTPAELCVHKQYPQRYRLVTANGLFVVDPRE